MGAGVYLREAQPGDEGPIEVLLSASYSELLKPAYDASLLAIALPIITKANPILLNSGSFYIAENANGNLLGCGCWTHDRPGTSERMQGMAHIRHFAVHPSCSRQGIGRMIYARCQKQAQEVGVKTFECYATLVAEPFYRALGFVKIGEDSVTLTRMVTFPNVLMRIDLGRGISSV
jgi:N-acetylglutamate synthase-like GNAT family acetyltransferase